MAIRGARSRAERLSYFARFGEGATTYLWAQGGGTQQGTDLRRIARAATDRTTFLRAWAKKEAPMSADKPTHLAGVPNWRPTKTGINLQAAIAAITGQAAPAPAPAAPEAPPSTAPAAEPSPGPPQAKPVGGFLRYGAAGTRILGSKPAGEDRPAASPVERPAPKAPPPLPLVPFQRPAEPEPVQAAPDQAAAPPEAPPVEAPAAEAPPPPPRRKGKKKAGQQQQQQRRQQHMPLLAAAQVDANTLTMLSLSGEPIPHPASIDPAPQRRGGPSENAPLKRTITLVISEDDYALITAFGAAMYPVAKPNAVLRGWISAQVEAIRKAQGGRAPRHAPW